MFPELKKWISFGFSDFQLFIVLFMTKKKKKAKSFYKLTLNSECISSIWVLGTSSNQATKNLGGKQLHPLPHLTAPPNFPYLKDQIVKKAQPWAWDTWLQEAFHFRFKFNPLLSPILPKWYNPIQLSPMQNNLWFIPDCRQENLW